MFKTSSKRKFMVTNITRQNKAVNNKILENKIFKGSTPRSAASKAGIAFNKASQNTFIITLKEVTGESGNPLLTSQNKEKIYKYKVQVGHSKEVYTVKDKQGNTRTISPKWSTTIHSIKH